jgi:urease accessory protein
MRRVDGIVGNAEEDPELADAVATHDREGTLETVVLDGTQRKRSRFRTTTDAGTDLGVLVDRPELRPDDVLVLDEDVAVVVAFEPREAFVVDVPAGADVAEAIELGHRIGNQHWDVAFEDGCLYVPVEADRSIIEATVGPYLPSGASTRYETVDAELFLTGDRGEDGGHGHDGSGHTHSHGDGAHGHGDGNDEHGHARPHDSREHSHDHGGGGE